MNPNNKKDKRESGLPAQRQRGPDEPEGEHVFWCRYWEAVGSNGVPAGREIGYERACARYIREIKPRRLKETPQRTSRAIWACFGPAAGFSRLEDPAGRR